MPSSFDVSFDSHTTVEQIHAAFARQDYWLDRIAAFGGAKTLRSLDVAPDGTVTSTIAEDLREGVMPALFAKVYPGDLNVVSTETWRPAGDRRVDGEISVAITGAPGSGRGTALLVPTDTGSRLTLSGTVVFKIPLVGGKIEKHVAGQFAEGLRDIQQFTTTWITENA